MQRAGLALLLGIILFLTTLIGAAPLPTTTTFRSSSAGVITRSGHSGDTSPSDAYHESARVLSLIVQRHGESRDRDVASVRHQGDFGAQYPAFSRQKISSPSSLRRPYRSLPSALDDDDVVVLHRRNIFSKIKKAFQKVGHAFKSAGKAIKKGFQKAGEGIKKVAKKVGNGIKTAAKKVGHFVKTTGKKIAKVALKVAATVQSVAARVVRFIPVVGQAASTALKFSSMGLNKASDAIHANLGKKWDKASKIMDAVQDPIGALMKAGAHKVAHATANKYRPAPPTQHQAGPPAQHHSAPPAPQHHAAAPRRRGKR